MKKCEAGSVHIMNKECIIIMLTRDKPLSPLISLKVNYLEPIKPNNIYEATK